MSMRPVHVPRACASASRAHSLCASRIARRTIRAASAAELQDGHANDSRRQKCSHTAKGVAPMAIFMRKVPLSWQMKRSSCPLRGGDAPTSMHINCWRCCK